VIIYNQTNVSMWVEGKDHEIAKLKVGDKETHDGHEWQVIAVFKDENKAKYKRLS
jgi:hypothetical protein